VEQDAYLAPIEAFEALILEERVRATIAAPLPLQQSFSRQPSPCTSGPGFLFRAGLTVLGAPVQLRECLRLQIKAPLEAMRQRAGGLSLPP